MHHFLLKIAALALSSALISCSGSPSGSDAAGGVKRDVDVCAMFSYAEMEAAMGIVPLEHKAGKGVPTGKECSWSNMDNDEGYFISTVGVVSSPELQEVWKSEQYDATWFLGQLKKNDSLDFSISEVGDDGVFYGGRLNQLYLLKEPYLLTIVLNIYPKMENDDAIAKERALALAKKLLSKLE